MGRRDAGRVSPSLARADRERRSDTPPALPAVLETAHRARLRPVRAQNMARRAPRGDRMGRWRPRLPRVARVPGQDGRDGSDRGPFLYAAPSGSVQPERHATIPSDRARQGRDRVKPPLTIDVTAPEGNVFALVAKATAALKQAGQPGEARILRDWFRTV